MTNIMTHNGGEAALINLGAALVSSISTSQSNVNISLPAVGTLALTTANLINAARITCVGDLSPATSAVNLPTIASMRALPEASWQVGGIRKFEIYNELSVPLSVGYAGYVHTVAGTTAITVGTDALCELEIVRTSLLVFTVKDLRQVRSAESLDAVRRVISATAVALPVFDVSCDNLVRSGHILPMVDTLPDVAVLVAQSRKYGRMPIGDNFVINVHNASATAGAVWSFAAGVGWTIVGARTVAINSRAIAVVTRTAAATFSIEVL